ncbi:LuxR family transcriptional regulator [Streptomyces sp. NPDC003077]|uniref:helix-turn-helix transcriptional regulator n=1 Tax=Streptomyces sp. NPDC003077 TaxID=3154443 RepID=UPI0033B44811
MIHGRDTELDQLARLVDEGRAGRGSVLVLRGAAGIGKSALLDRAAEFAASGPEPLRVVRAGGAEAEQDMPYAAVDLLTRALPDSPPLPGAQARALDLALGRAGAAPRAAPSPDRFLIGLAVLNLLAGAGPLLCLIDDAHWLDRASGDALLFAARRLGADPVVMVFAARDGFAARGLPELPLGPLDGAAQRRVLAERGHDLTPADRDAILEAAEGNPCALRELRPGPTPFTPLPVGERVTAEYRHRIAALPERTRVVLTVAAAAAGALPAVARAAEALGGTVGDLAPAEAADLVTVLGDTVRFRHPLARSAAYQAAPLARRLAVHAALAEAAEDPYVRARHRTVVASGPDEGTADELAAVAADAWRRAAYEASATAYEQSARLSPDPVRQGDRLTAGARAALRAGRADHALDLTERAAQRLDAPEALAEVAFVRAQAETELRPGTLPGAGRLLLDHVPSAAPSRRSLLLNYAAAGAWAGGDLAALRRAGELHDVLEARGGPAAVNVPRALVRLVEGRYGEAFGPLAALVAEQRDRPSPEPHPRLAALEAALLTGNDEAALDLARAEIALCRADGVIVALPKVLHQLARAESAAGLHRDAARTADEALDLARSTGLDHLVAPLAGVRARLAAIEGDEPRCRELAAGARPAEAACALGLLALGQGRYEDAVRELHRAAEGPLGYPAVAALLGADLVEAAVRAGLPADEPLARLTSWARAAGHPWARAVALRGRGLAEGAEEPLAEAVRQHEGRPFERARSALVHGAWLRRQRRRTDARPLLKSALEAFERLGAAPWAERARTELRATGEQVTGGRAADAVDRLTAQELQIARLAAAGVANRDIASQLFLSTRTVEYHLYKAYPKLGVRSRRELAEVPGL